MTKRSRPFCELYVPEIPKGHPVKEDISTNIIANILGLGWAATPAGLQAMKGLEELNPHPGTATKVHVYLSDHQYILSTADSDQYDRLQKPVRLRKSGGRGGACAGGYADHHAGGHNLRQDYEQKGAVET